MNTFYMDNTFYTENTFHLMPKSREILLKREQLFGRRGLLLIEFLESQSLTLRFRESNTNTLSRAQVLYQVTM